MFSPPIIPGRQQLEEHTKSSTNQSISGRSLWRQWKGPG